MCAGEMEEKWAH